MVRLWDRTAEVQPLCLSLLKGCPAPGAPTRLSEGQLPLPQRRLRLLRPGLQPGQAPAGSPARPARTKAASGPRPPPSRHSRPARRAPRPRPLAHHGAGHGVHQALVGGHGRHRGGSRLQWLWLQWLWLLRRRRLLLGPARRPRGPGQLWAAARRPRARHGTRPVTCARGPAPRETGIVRGGFQENFTASGYPENALLFLPL